jgi:SAM-dependent methyltransferase
MPNDMPLGLPPEAFAKQDPSDDALFYRPARLVQHLDEGARAALTAHYQRVLTSGSDVLDLMSSWVSHLPDAGVLPLRRVAGHGMNAEELAANPRLTEWWVQDLNADPALPMPDAAFDAVTCCVGVQYLQRPVEVMAEARRVLRPGGRVAVSYSNRCFPTKAVAAWHALDMAGRAALVAGCLTEAGFADVTARALSDGTIGDPLVVIAGGAGV